MSSEDSYDGALAKGPIYTSLGESTEILVADDEVEDGVIDSREARSDSLMSIVSVHFEDVADYKNSDSDEEAIAIKDGSPATKDDAIMNLRLNSRTLKPLGYYLRSTFQWIPSRVSPSQRAFCTLMQALILAFLCCCYAFDMGAFDNRSLIAETWGETVTNAKNIIWSFRFLEMNILGVLYFRKRHLENMLSKVRLTRRYWEKVRRTIYKIVLAVFLFVFVFPITLRVAQMTMNTKKAASFEIKQIALNVALSLLARLVALPIFFAFVYVVYITFCHIRFYKEQIQKWPHSKEQARNRFLDIKSIIRDTERSFQAFLLVHLLLLLVLLVPAVFSCAERLHSESQYQETYTDQFKLASSDAKAKTLEDPLIVANLTNNHTQTVRIVLQLHVPKDVGRYKVNKTRPAFVPRTRSHLDAYALVKVICSALGDFLEMTVLFSLPIIFLAKVDKIMKSLPEIVENLKFAEQERHGYLFQDRQVLDEMLQDLSTGRGVQIMRMNLTGVKAAVLTLLMPFLTTIFKLLFVHVDIT